MKPVKIVPPESDGLYCLTQGTQVFCGDEKIHGIEAIDIGMEVNDVIRAKLTLSCWFTNIEGAKPAVQMRHPFTGKLIEISKLILADGSEVDLTAEVEFDPLAIKDVSTLDSTAREYMAGDVCK